MLPCKKRWNCKEFHAYLRTCCVSEARRTIIADYASHNHEKGTCTIRSEWLPSIWLSWDCFDWHIFPDMPMHALAHGMGDDVIQFNHAILTNFKRGSKFAKIANETLLEIAFFNLDWCKPKSYPKSAWVGENIMAFMRLCSYLYGMYLLNNSFPPELHNLEIAMKRLINAFQAMLSVLMSDNPPEPHLIQARIKLFMTTAHYCDLEFIPTEAGYEKERKSMDKETT